MKTLIAFIRQWLHRFWGRFSTYELCLPHEEESRVPKESVSFEAQPVRVSESAAVKVIRRRQNGFDTFIARLRRDVEGERRKLCESKGQSHNHRR